MHSIDNANSNRDKQSSQNDTANWPWPCLRHRNHQGPLLTIVRRRLALLAPGCSVRGITAYTSLQCHNRVRSKTLSQRTTNWLGNLLFLSFSITRPIIKKSSTSRWKRRLLLLSTNVDRHLEGKQNGHDICWTCKPPMLRLRRM